MKPTQAQIEAAKGAHRTFMWNIINIRKPTAEDEDAAIAAALTAAAEVHEFKYCTPECNPEVGEREQILKELALEVATATIERCAQKVETRIGVCSLTDHLFRELAAEIRAMKDKPKVGSNWVQSAEGETVRESPQALVRATIERCAQRAESKDLEFANNEKIAAAIRALKEAG